MKDQRSPEERWDLLHLVLKTERGHIIVEPLDDSETRHLTEKVITTMKMGMNNPNE